VSGCSATCTAGTKPTEVRALTKRILDSRL
jgi:hypothetical protein